MFGYWVLFGYRAVPFNYGRFYWNLRKTSMLFSPLVDKILYIDSIFTAGLVGVDYTISVKFKNLFSYALLKFLCFLLLLIYLGYIQSIFWFNISRDFSLPNFKGLFESNCPCVRCYKIKAFKLYLCLRTELQIIN